MDLYSMAESPPCRSVLMVIDYLGVRVNLINVDLSKGQHLEPSFLKLNPFHLIPTLVDGDLILWESRAIIKYIVDKYSPDNQLYPKDVEKRAKIDQWLYQEMGTYNLLSGFMRPVFSGSKPDVTGKEKFMDSMKLIDNHLEENNYLANNNLTIADISFIGSLSYAEACSVDLSSFKKIVSWMDRVKNELTNYNQINSSAMVNLTNYMQHLISITE
uniref:Glutathione S-transferases n=1 Tax=Panonychus citri TaxID=50023 RepID=A0A1W5KPB9_PANCT|nr:glutathione S-transferases [Panonychus citri]